MQDSQKYIQTQGQLRTVRTGRPGCGWVRVEKGLAAVWQMGQPGPIQDGPDNGFGGDRKIFTHEDM